MPQPATIYLIDGSAYIFRAYHAIRGLRNSSGMPTNAVFGFTRMVIKLLEERQPEYIGMFFDTKGPTFRHERYDAYKANRPPMAEDLAVQIPLIKTVSKAFNLPVYELAGWEADDLIATVAHAAADQGHPVIMVTGDKDFMQLVTPRVTIWDPMKDLVIDEAYVRDNFGVAPPQMIDIQGLAGDSADNVPGVPGIGMKTAAKLVVEFGSMAAVYDQVATITRKKQKENLINFKEQALLSRELVTIRRDAPIDFEAERLKFKAPDRPALAQLFQELEFRQLQKAYAGELKEVTKTYTAIQDREALDGLVAELERAPIIALDTETTSKDPHRARLVGFSFAVRPHEAWYIPCGHDYFGAPEQLALEEVIQRLNPVFSNPAIKKAGQNIKYDWIVLERHGIRLEGVVFDTMVASYLLNPSKRAHNLDQIALDFLGHKTISYKDLVPKGRKPPGFNAIPLEKAVPYAAEDADITLLAHGELAPRLTKLGLDDLFTTVEMPLIAVLKRMETAGIGVDPDRLQSLSATFAAEIDTLEGEIYELAGETFNIKSSQQLGAILFEKLDLPVQKKTRKTKGYSTDVEVLTKLAGLHPLPERVLRHRTLAKLKSTYADALYDLIHPQTGRIHSSFNQTIAATGRLSSSDPNLQNIPIRTEEGRQIREAFIPRPGWVMVAADYSQIELRILAHYARDPVLIDAFKEGEDIHARTAREVFQAPADVDFAELRRQAKVINFGIIYGMGAFSLARELGITQKMAQTYIDNYFARYEGVKAFIDQTKETARRTQQASTLLGRIRLLPDINARNYNQRRFAERTAVNTPIQGTAADLIKLAMIRADEELRERKMTATMLLSVHDELVFEAPADEVEDLARLVKSVMEGIWELAVPLKVNLQQGRSWAEVH